MVSYNPPRQTATQSREFNLVNSFKLGYRNREDVTNLPPGVLIKGSQNVLTNVSERIQIRKGYTVDGQESTVIAPILASFDWQTRGNDERHLRAGFLTVAGNDGKLQYRYVSGTGTVTWNDLLTGLSTVAYNFTTWWNSTESLRECLFVNGTSNIYRWNGAITPISARTTNTISKTGDTWADSGFYTTADKKIVINGTTYTYTGGETTTTLTGVTPDPSGEAIGSLAVQAVVTTANSAMSGITATFKNGVISTLNNQVFVGSLTSSVVYISKITSYTDFTSSTPRQAGEGAALILDANVVAFRPQEDYMYVSAGKDFWYNVSFETQTSTVGVTYQQVNALRLKTGKMQGAISQAGVSQMKNNIIMITNETTIDILGRIEQYFGTPMTKNLSDSIKLDIDAYDFTDASIAYHRYYIYVAIPKDNKVIIYNLATGSWESPQVLPISRFYIVDGDLYGHSYATSESYKLFEGYADRVYPGFSGHPIDATAKFSYQNFGTRSSYKRANSFYIEGYISGNANLIAELTYELDGCATTKVFNVSGSDTQIVCIPPAQGSLGIHSLGKIKLGGDNADTIQDLPPKFRVEKTFTNTSFFEVSPSFSVLGTDNRFELLAFGLNVTLSSEEPVKIRQ